MNCAICQSLRLSSHDFYINCINALRNYPELRFRAQDFSKTSCRFLALAAPPGAPLPNVFASIEAEWPAAGKRGRFPHWFAAVAAQHS
jgi:hypothetical protein